jgi:hypothetical protein
MKTILHCYSRGCKTDERLIKVDKANLLLLLAHGAEKMTLLEGGASISSVRRS